MTLPIDLVIFYAFASVSLLSAIMMIISKNPVKAALLLVLCFIATSGLWLMLNAEFLALTLILVYVGAVMILFLFVLMMLDINIAESEHQYVNLLFVAVCIVLILFGVFYFMFYEYKLEFLKLAVPVRQFEEDYSNTKAIARVLYKDYVFAFEIAAVILLLGIISAITLAIKKDETNEQSSGVKTKYQRIGKQVMANKSERLSVIKFTNQENKQK